MTDQKKLIYYLMNDYDKFLKIAIMIVRNKDAALDVVQNVALVLLEKDTALDGIITPAAYLTTCVRRCALNHLKKAANYQVTDPEVFKSIPSDLVQSAFDYTEWVVTIERMLESYPEELRRAFILHYIDGYTQEEVASQLNMKPGTLRQHFLRMRRKIATRSENTENLLSILLMM